MTKYDKTEIIEWVKSFMEGTVDYEPWDSNHKLVRNFRGMIGGDYRGEEYYQLTLDRVRDANGDLKKIRGVAKNAFSDMLQDEFPDWDRTVLFQTFRKTIGPDMDRFVGMLITDLQDFAKNHGIELKAGGQ